MKIIYPTLLIIFSLGLLLTIILINTKSNKYTQDSTRPYLYIHNVKWIGDKNKDTLLTFDLKNLGNIPAVYSLYITFRENSLTSTKSIKYKNQFISPAGQVVTTKVHYPERERLTLEVKNSDKRELFMYELSQPFFDLINSSSEANYNVYLTVTYQSSLGESKQKYSYNQTLTIKNNRITSVYTQSSN